MKKIIWALIILAVIGGIIFLLARQASKPGKYDTFAQCITDSGTKFYGAWWCPHCQATKALFGKSAKLLPYVECSTKNGKGQLQVCIDEQVEGYPTWEISKPLAIASETAPNICHPLGSEEAANDPEACTQPGAASSFRNVYFFPGSPRIISKDAPTEKAGVWTFPAGARMSGELTLEDISKITNCPAQ